MKGYIAITTSIILAFLILAVAISLGSSSLFTRFNAVDFNNKQISYFTARSCASYALLKLTENANYGGNESLYVSEYQCSILPLETSGLNKVIKARSQVNGAVTNLKLTVAADTLSTVSLEEITKF